LKCGPDNVRYLGQSGEHILPASSTARDLLQKSRRTQAARGAKGRACVGEILVVFIETTIATKPSEGPLFIARGDRGHRSATSSEPVRAGMIATRSKEPDQCRERDGRPQRNGRRVAITEAPATAEQLRLSRKGGAGARREATKDREGRAIRSRCKAPTSHALTFAPRKTITHCNCNHFAPIRSRSVTAISHLRLRLSQLAGLLSRQGGHGRHFFDNQCTRIA
jgi:hypothetical protein